VIPALALWVRRARDAEFGFRTMCAGSAYGDHDEFRGELAHAGLPFVMALKPRRGTWAYGPDAHTPVDVARSLAWGLRPVLRHRPVRRAEHRHPGR
jgi:SRSO17 transposase